MIWYGWGGLILVAMTAGSLAKVWRNEAQAVLVTLVLLAALASTIIIFSYVLEPVT